MKKTYQNPTITVVTVTSRHIISASSISFSATSVDNANQAEVHRSEPRDAYNVWDDDWNK